MSFKRFFKILLILISLNIIFGNFLFANELELYKKNVTASYYAEKFHGKKTSNGENYNMYDYTCAHKELPFGTMLKVTNLANGKSVTVRVNDRGPFVANREIDLSKAAAIKLDMIESGTAKVKIEILQLQPHTKQSAQTAQKATAIMNAKLANNTNGSKNRNSQNKDKPKENSQDKKRNSRPEENAFWEIQVGAFAEKSNAQDFGHVLMKQGFKKIVLQKAGDVYRVKIIDIKNDDLEKTKERLTKNGYTDFTVRARK